MDNTILIVDDEPQIRETFAKAFSRKGYETMVADSAETALELMRHTPCWVIFLDLNMPGMNGIELCKEIRKNWPMAICHAVTGYVSIYELADCREAGFEDYFTKPVKLEDLFQAAENAFQKLMRWREPTG